MTFFCFYIKVNRVFFINSPYLFLFCEVIHRRKCIKHYWQLGQLSEVSTYFVLPQKSRAKRITLYNNRTTLLLVFIIMDDDNDEMIPDYRFQ